LGRATADRHGRDHEWHGRARRRSSVPNLTVIRPGDSTETAVAWNTAVEHEGGPVALVLTRQKLAFIDRSADSGFAPASGVSQGAYVLADPPKGTKPRVVLMSSGSEVDLIVKAKAKLAEAGIPARIVSMPSMELFARQPDAYRTSVLPDGIPRVAIEAAHPMSWYKWVGTDGTVIGLERYGASAKYEKIYEELGITAEKVVEAARKLVR
jgi:transketolase